MDSLRRGDGQGLALRGGGVVVWGPFAQPAEWRGRGWLLLSTPQDIYVPFSLSKHLGFSGEGVVV